MQKFRIEFEDSNKFSMNKLWAGGKAMTWIRKAQADDWHYETEKAVEDCKIKKVTKPCVLLFFYSFKKNMLDSSNCAPMSKMIEDTLTRSGILATDTNTHVKGTYNVSVEKPMSERKLMQYHTVDVVIVEEGETLYEDLVKIESTIR